MHTVLYVVRTFVIKAGRGTQVIAEEGCVERLVYCSQLLVQAWDTHCWVADEEGVLERPQPLDGERLRLAPASFHMAQRGPLKDLPHMWPFFAASAEEFPKAFKLRGKRSRTPTRPRR